MVTDQRSNCETCGDAGDRAGADIPCDAANGREGAEDKSHVLAHLCGCVSNIRDVGGAAGASWESYG